MPVVGIPVERLGRLLGRELASDELRYALEQLGNDVEGYAKVTHYRCERCGQLVEALEHEDFNNTCPDCGPSGALAEVSSGEVIRISLLPVRPDLFDAVGLARALRGFLDIETGLPEWPVTESGLTVEVAPGMEKIRPHIVAAVVRGLKLDDETVRMLMKMQENLHWALGRDRRRASIGVYNLATVKPGFRFRSVGPDELRFVPLFGLPDDPKARCTPREILEKHPKGRGYAHLLTGLEQYPLIEDADGRVLSMPPIINSDETRVTRATGDILIDVTGPDPTAINRCLNVLVTALADAGGRIETVRVRYPDGREMVTPDLAPVEREISPADAARVLGLSLEAGEIAGLLQRLRYGASVAEDRVRVRVPAYRSDIMHDYDVFEDVAIGYGYERIAPRLAATMTVGRPHPEKELAAELRTVMTGFGFLEVMTLELTNPREQFELLGITDPDGYPAIENPLNIDQSMPRVHLLTGLLVSFRGNVARAMPQTLFEIGNCYALDPEEENGVRSGLRLAAGITGPKAAFADVRALVAAVGREWLGDRLDFAAHDHPAFIPGRCARVRLCQGDKEIPLGILGELHPQVLENFGLNQPVALFEIHLDPAC